MEQNLIFLSVTAIEDELQPDVAETIQKIKESNINFWILTGDKEETALSIGYSTRVIEDSEHSRLIHLSKIQKQLTHTNGMLQVLQQAENLLKEYN